MFLKLKDLTSSTSFTVNNTCVNTKIKLLLIPITFRNEIIAKFPSMTYYYI